MQKSLSWLERRRMRAAAMFARGICQVQVARKLGVSAQSAHRWHRLWKQKGEEGLKSRGPRGPRARLCGDQLKELNQALLGGPGRFGYSTELWTLERIADVVRRLFGVRHHPSHVWAILRKLGWSCQRPATRARERDDEAVQRWLKERWPPIKKGRTETGPS